MRISLAIKRISLLSAIAFSVLLPGFTATTTYAAGNMDGMGMGQTRTDVTNCLERHQAPTAPIDKESKQTDPEDKDEPIPPELPYYANFQKLPTGTAKPARKLIESSSFVPPDILILTSTLRI
jgi:hypothetical protein